MVEFRTDEESSLNIDEKRQSSVALTYREYKDDVNVQEWKQLANNTVQDDDSAKAHPKVDGRTESNWYIWRGESQEECWMQWHQIAQEYIGDHDDLALRKIA